MAGNEDGVSVLRMVRLRAAPAGTIVLALVSLAMLASGCGRDGEGEGAASGGASGEEPASVAAYPSSLSADSSPEEVVGVLIQALDEDDDATLIGLVAVKAEVKAVEAIFRRGGRSAKLTPESVAPPTAGGWGASYAFFRAGETQVDSATVEGDTAVVLATGNRLDGTPSTLKVKLVREDGLWKVRAGLESLGK